MSRFLVTKTYGHELGLSCAFRQWRAASHCRQLHGYALSFKFVFEANGLDANGWVIDFGALGPLKEVLKKTFDHTVAVAGDDPGIKHFEQLQEAKIANVILFPSGVGCEKFAKYAYWTASGILSELALRNTPRVISCEVAEHGANSAIYFGGKE